MTLSEASDLVFFFRPDFLTGESEAFRGRALCGVAVTDHLPNLHNLGTGHQDILIQN